jgi:catechol 2,3-dioxygenase-like lactoylglutathione lyase family enzyme
VDGGPTLKRIVRSLSGLAPFQIAFIVRDLERAVREFDARLCAGPWRGWIFGPQGEGREYRGTPAEWTLRLALNGHNPQYELIEPLEGPSIHADWLAERGGGFHHVAYVVDSVDAVTAEMEAAGHPAIARIRSFGAAGDGAAAYYDTAGALGFLVEAVEPPTEMPAVDFTF